MPKLRIEESAAKRQAGIDRGDITVVGVNKYKTNAASDVNLLTIDNNQVRLQQIALLKQIRATRNQAAVSAALAQVGSGGARMRTGGDGRESFGGCGGGGAGAGNAWARFRTHLRKSLPATVR